MTLSVLGWPSRTQLQSGVPSPSHPLPPCSESRSLCTRPRVWDCRVWLPLLRVPEGKPTWGSYPASAISQNLVADKPFFGVGRRACGVRQTPAQIPCLLGDLGDDLISLGVGLLTQAARLQLRDTPLTSVGAPGGCPLHRPLREGYPRVPQGVAPQRRLPGSLWPRVAQQSLQ